MCRVIDSCEVGKSPDAPRLIRATGKEKPRAMSGLLAALNPTYRAGLCSGIETMNLFLA